MTVKYIYGPATVNSASDDVIGSSISGRIETNVGIGRMTTIAMPMKGEPNPNPNPNPNPYPNPNPNPYPKPNPNL